MGILARLESRVAEMTSRLDELASMGIRSWVEELAALHALQVQAQALLDMVLRLAAELGYAPESVGEAARILHSEGLLDRGELMLIRRIIGFRNILVHEYTRIDMSIIMDILERREYRRLAILAAGLLERAHKMGLDP